MHHRTIESVMTRDVITVDAAAGFKEIAALLEFWQVSAVPVVDADRRVIGVVSEADLLRKECGDNLPRGARGLRTRIAARAKARAQDAAGLMTAPAITAPPGLSLVDAARLMERRRIKRLPVIDADGRLLGLVSRRDLLRVFLRPDAELRDDIADGLLRHELYIGSDEIEVEVERGVVRLTGRVEHKSLIGIVVRLCREVDGVVAIDDRLEYEVDDSHLRTAPPSPRTPAWP